MIEPSGRGDAAFFGAAACLVARLPTGTAWVAIAVSAKLASLANASASASASGCTRDSDGVDGMLFVVSHDMVKSLLDWGGAGRGKDGLQDATTWRFSRSRLDACSG
jgi:hypothetical protein